MDNKKKIILSGLAMTLVAGATSGAALAYLTDGETAENTFTIGDVSIEGIEPNYPGNDSDDVQDIVPNKEVNKDPQIDNDGVNDAIVFMTVDSPMEYVTIIGDNGVVQTEKSMNEIFWFKDKEDPQSKHENNFDENWQNLPAKEMYVKVAADGTETKLVETTPEALKATYDALQPGEKLVKRHVFGYKQPIQGSSTHDGTPQTAENKVTAPLFDKVQLKNVVENEIDEAVEKIVVRSYAIQATNILENSVDLGTNLNEANLGKIYDIFVRQNSEGNDASGTKLNEARDVDLLTPTNNGASGTTDPHKNRFGTDSNVISPNNVNPNMPITYNGIYGDWYSDFGGQETHYVFNEDGTYKAYYNGVLDDEGMFEFNNENIVMTSNTYGKSPEFPYSLNSDSTLLNLTQSNMTMSFTRVAPMPKRAATLDDILGDWYYAPEPTYILKQTFNADGTASFSMNGESGPGDTFTLENGILTFGSDGYSETCLVSEDGQKLYLGGQIYTRTVPEMPEALDLSKFAGEYVYTKNCSTGKKLSLQVKVTSNNCTEYRIKIDDDGTLTGTGFDKAANKMSSFYPDKYDFSEEEGTLLYNGIALTKETDGTFGKVYVQRISKNASEAALISTYLFREGETVRMLPDASSLYTDSSMKTKADTTTEIVNGATYYSVTGER